MKRAGTTRDEDLSDLEEESSFDEHLEDAVEDAGDVEDLLCCLSVTILT